jgi:hypothetical protein
MSPGATCLKVSRWSRDLTGVMTFVVNQDGIVYQKDLGPGTDAATRKMSSYNPDPSWHQAR